MSKKKSPGKSASEITEEFNAEAFPGRCKELDGVGKAISLRAFIKLLRADQTLEDLDRLKVCNTERKPVTSVVEINGMMVVSFEGE